MEKKALELAWIAGFFDGEGNVFVSRDHSVELSVGQRNPEPLEILRGRFGGTIQKRVGGGLAEGDIFVWRLSRKAAQDALASLLPYLVVKKEQARLALVLRTLTGPSGLRVTDERRALRDEVRRRVCSLNSSARSRAIASALPPMPDFEERVAQLA